MSDKSQNITKILFFILNSLFLLLGVVILAIGIYLQISEASNYMKVLPNIKFATPVSLLIAAGVITIVICILGFCAAFFESHCLLIVYIVCVTSIFCIEIAAGAIGFVRKDQLEDDLVESLILGLKKTRKSWDVIQEDNKCCGVTNYTDWQGEVLTASNLPESCCIAKCQSVYDAYPEPCLSKLKTWVTSNLYQIGAAGIVIGILQIALLVIASIFLCFMRR